MISLNLVLAGLRLGLKNRQVGEKWVSDDCSYLCKGLTQIINKGVRSDKSNRSKENNSKRR
ncbi:hypothetical protein BSPLISOX_599 [uncultured Gammaproteobacteria bacterium]|nr:hypothetical protein [uncultured Gammaproteobacteria bacterium]VVH66175.1 hypothetical protein BSPLISOX_599 [uncultured Gammaproteobacteria bacterium]